MFLRRTTAKGGFQDKAVQFKTPHFNSSFTISYISKQLQNYGYILHSYVNYGPSLI